MEYQNFLFELGTEELPPKALPKLSAAFTEAVQTGLQALFSDTPELLANTEFKAYAAPRRLALMIENLPTDIPGKSVTVSGPPVKICFDESGNPTPALQGFAKKCGTEVDALTEQDGKMSFLREEPARAIQADIAQLVSKGLDSLPIPKRMRWGASKIEFVRPVHWCLMLLGNDVIDAEVLGHKAGRTTYGHRFHYNQAIEINEPSEYAAKLLETGYVIADFASRRDRIVKQVKEVARGINAQAVIDEDLLDEVTALVEWPVALAGRFEERFLAVPAEALVSSMKEHQKYFHVVDAKGAIQPYFITVSNIESTDPAQVIAGNERVIRPRLSDAAFFFETDKKYTLESRVDKLKSIVFQQQLGTVYEKSQRVGQLAAHIAKQIGTNAERAARAGLLSKTDLVTEMVLEFDDLQGLMGYYYAVNDGEDSELALALMEQYRPKFAGDSLPETLTGCALALADRIDTLTGLFGINQPPTGSKDPFALRRSTLGVLRIMVEKELDLDLSDLLAASISLHSDLPAADGLSDRVLDFMLERFRAWYEDEGVPVEVFLAVMATRPTKPLDFAKRVRAVNHFRTLTEAEPLAAANKRVSNILSKADGIVATDVNVSLLSDAAESELFEKVQQAQTETAPLFAAGDYTAAYTALANLKDPIDAFFDQVMVMADDEAIRNNRLALLSQLRALFLQGADISLL